MGAARFSLAGRAKVALQDAAAFAALPRRSPAALDDADPALHDLAAAAVAPWRNTSIDGAALSDALDALAHRHPHVFVYDIGGGRVRIRPKHGAPATPLAIAQMPHFFARAWRYRALIAAALKTYGLAPEMTLAIDVNDLPLAEADVPLFAFQNAGGTRALLLPDVDFLSWTFYAGRDDRLPYEKKAIRAVFAGSSSGRTHTVESILAPDDPRLAAAAHFAGHNLIDVRIARAVQCETPEAKALLERQPYFKPPLSWPQQWKNRFLISIDGNGATCSRVALALKSRAALVKYASPFALFYFPALRPGADFLTVEGDEAVEAIVEAELVRPGLHRDIAEGGRAFYRRFLRRDPLLAYTALLLRAYAGVIGTPISPRTAPP